MKKVLSTAVGALLAVGVTLGGAATAFAAGNSHASTAHGQSANHEQSTNHGQSGSTTHGQASGTHGKSGTTHGQAGSQGKSSVHNQLKQLINERKTAQQEDRAAHKALVVAKQNFEKALQAAVASGNTGAVTQATAQMQDVMKVLRQAIADQRQAKTDVLAADRAQQHGSLTNATNVMTEMIALLKAEGQLMSNATTYLNMMTQELESNPGSFGNNTTNDFMNNTTWIWNGVNAVNGVQ